MLESTGYVRREQDILRALLTDQGRDTTATTLALFSLHGCYPDLLDLPTLYGD